jgi:hypothetical protein
MMVLVSPEEWRDLVGQHIRRRREALRLSVRGAAARAGFSEGQWRQMESGLRTVARGQFVTVNPRPSTRASASTALGWTIDSIDRLERGEDPVAAGSSGRPDVDTVLADHERRLARLESLVDRLTSSADQFGRAADGASGLPPAESGRRLSRPQPAPEGGDHLTD